MAVRRTLLTLLIDAGADIGVLGGLTAINATNTETRMVRSALRRTAAECCRRGLMIREHSFYTVSGTASYSMPADYMLPVLNTTWNATDKWPLSNVSQRRWQSDRSGFVASSVHQRYRIQPIIAKQGLSNSDHLSGRRFHIDPVPTGAKKITFNYHSDHWASLIDLNNVTVTGVTLSGTDEVVVTITSHGINLGDVVGFFGVGGTTELNTDNVYTVSAITTNTITLLNTNSADFTAYTSGGQMERISDTDAIALTDGTAYYPILPDELIEMGVAYRLRQRMGMSYFDHKDEYETVLNHYVGATHGDHVISLNKQRTGYVGIPDGNFPSS